MNLDSPIAVGRYHELTVLKTVDFGIYLDAGFDEILVPKRYVPEGTLPGDQLNVFVYRDSEDRLIATTEKPLATVNTFAFLRVKDTNEFGLFLDWGLEKDLFMPFSEQYHPLAPGRSYLVYLYLDNRTDRVVASARLDKFLRPATGELDEGQQVQLTAWEYTDLGVKVLIDKLYLGLLFRNELFEPLQPGDTVTGYVKKVREDGKADVTLRKAGYAEVMDARKALSEALQANQGFLPLTDHSSPEEIYQQLHMSKKTFKKAVGGLLRQSAIRIGENGIYYVALE